MKSSRKNGSDKIERVKKGFIAIRHGQLTEKASHLRAIVPFRLRKASVFSLAQLFQVHDFIMISWVVPWVILVERAVNVIGIEVANLDKEAGTLEYVHMVFRHGEISIAKKYKQDPYKEEKFWPEGMGLMTSQGILNQYHLGQWIGERYLSILQNRKFNRKLFKIYSGPKEENILSATANAHGIFTSAWTETLNEMKWVPIPVIQDKTFQFTDFKCSKYEELNKKFLSSTEYNSLRSKYEELFASVKNYTGIDDRPLEFKDLAELWNTFVIESNNKLALHDWAKGVFPKAMAEAVAMAYILPTWTPEMKKTVGGRFFKSLIDSLSNKSNGTDKDRNMTVFSMDDFSIASILDVMGMFNSVAPPFDSLIMIELRKAQDYNYVVTVLYHNETTTNSEGKVERVVHLLKLPNCTEACPLDKFKEIISLYTVDNWNSHCQNENDQVPSDDVKPANGTSTTPPVCNKFNWKQIIVQLGIGGTILLLVVISMCKWKKKNSVVINNLNKTGNTDEDNEEIAESANMFLTSLGGTPSMFIDPLYSPPPFEIFTLAPPFMPPADMGAF